MRIKKNKQKMYAHHWTRSTRAANISFDISNAFYGFGQTNFFFVKKISMKRNRKWKSVFIIKERSVSSIDVRTYLAGMKKMWKFNE